MAASSIGELACTYAALILHDDGIPITVLPFFPSLFIYGSSFVRSGRHDFSDLG